METRKIIRNFVEFCGSVPTTSNRLKGINEKDDIVFACSRDKMSKVLDELGKEYNNENIMKASDLFSESGNVLKAYVSYI